MKYRVSASSLISSFLIVFLLGVFVVYFSIPEIGQQYLLNLFSKSEKSANYKIKFNNVDRKFLQDIKVKGLSFTFLDDEITTIEKIDLGTNLQGIVSHYFSGNQIFDITINNASLSVNEKDIENFTNNNQSSSSINFFTSILERTGFKFSIYNSDIKFNYQDLQIENTIFNGTASLDYGLNLSNLSLSFFETEIGYKGKLFNLKETDLAINENDELGLIINGFNFKNNFSIDKIYFHGLSDLLFDRVENPEGKGTIYLESVEGSYQGFDFNIDELNLNLLYNFNQKNFSSTITSKNSDFSYLDYNLKNSLINININYLDKTNIISSLSLENSIFTLVNKRIDSISLPFLNGNLKYNLITKDFSSNLNSNLVNFSEMKEFGLNNTEVSSLSATVNYLDFNYSGIFDFVGKTDFSNSILGNFKSNIHFEFQENDLIQSAKLVLDDFYLKTIGGGNNLTLNYKQDKEIRDINFDMNLLNSVLLEGDYNLFNDDILVNLELKDFNFATFNNLYEILPNITKKFIKPSTNFSSSIRLENNGFQNLNGNIFLTMAAKDLDLYGKNENFALIVKANSKDDLFFINNFTLSGLGLRLYYDGTINNEIIQQGDFDNFNLLPEGKFVLQKIQNGEKLLALDFLVQNENLSVFNLSSPLKKDFYFKGEIVHDDTKTYELNTELNYSNINYSLKFLLDFQDLTLSILSTGLSLNLGYDKENSIFNIDGNLDEFPLWFPSEKSLGLSSIIKGKINLLDDIFNFSLENFEINGFEEGILRFDFDVTNSEVNFENIKIGFSKDDPAYGFIKFNFDNWSTLFQRDFSNLTFRFSLIKDDEQIEAAFLKQQYLVEVQNVNLNDFIMNKNSSKSIFNLKILGRTQEDSYGTFSLNLNDKILNGNLYYKNLSLDISNGNLDFGDLQIKNLEGTIDLKNLDFNLGGFVDYNKTQSEKDVNHSFNFATSTNYSLIFEKLVDYYNLKEFKLSNLSNFNFSIPDFNSLIEGLTLKMVFSNFDLCNSEYKLDDLNFNISYLNNNLLVNGNYLNGNYNFAKKSINLALNKKWGFGFNIDGNFNSEFDIYINNLYLPANIINYLIDFPVVNIYEGILEGELYLYGDAKKMHSYGTITSDKTGFSLFFTPGQIIHIPNLSLFIVDGEMNTPNLPIFFEKEADHIYKKGKIQFIGDLSNPQNFTYKLLLDAVDPVYVWYPISNNNFNINIEVEATGLITLGDDGEFSYFYTDVSIANSLIDTIFTREIPSWYPIEGKFAVNLNIVTGKNNEFYFPGKKDPILNVTLNENQKININLDPVTNEFGIDGQIGFKSGQIYYFQKDFRVNSGTLKFQTEQAGKGNEGILIDLSAKIRDYDSDGNKVDIYLKLKDASLNNINPTFESIPSLSENEILKILGQNILPTGIYQGASLSSVASVTVAAADAISKLGLLNTNENFNITQVIKESLSLDMFTFRSNIVQNLVTEVLPGGYISKDIDPVARYLDGTNFYFGKYLGNDLFLQGYLGLKAEKYSGNKMISGFLSEDLILDMEISVDWENPLGVFSVFFKPTELSIFNLFDTIGFSISKKISF